jgi:hypothetical protein
MKKIIFIVILLVLVGGSFYGGMFYAQNQNRSQRPNDFQGILNGNLQGGNIQRGTGGAMLNGEIISNDGESITLKISDDSSKIVFFSDTTKVSKTTEGIISDVAVGKQVMISGTQNSDGSYTAKTITISSIIIK